MHHPPTFSYRGLTIIMSNPSRFDLSSKKLLSAVAGDWFNNTCLAPQVNRYQCDIKDIRDFNGTFLPNTKCVLTLGQYATQQLLGHSNTTIHQQRGSPFTYKGLPVIGSYLPQDSFDPIAAHELRNNPILAEQQHEVEEDEDDDDESAEKSKGRTLRSNWRFWLEKDTKKILRVLANDGKVPEEKQQFKFNIYPVLGEAINELLTRKNEFLYYDIETDCAQNFTCIGFHFSGSDTVYVVPVLRYNYVTGYTDLPKFFRALIRAQKDNTTVIHNSSFDLFIQAFKYHMPFGRRVYDTMLAQHRCYPEVEKSLGHCVSLWTYKPYHKNENVFMPNNSYEEEKLWNYNAKDVATMRLIHEAIDKHARTIPGLVDSINQVNASIPAYIINTLFGIRYNQERVNEMLLENDRYMTQYLRWLRILVGAELLPTSSKQLASYFHDALGYDVIARTDKGAPSLRGEAMYKLKLKHPDNPVIDICLAYKEASKERGSLGFIPWKTNEQQTEQARF